MGDPSIRLDLAFPVELELLAVRSHQFSGLALFDLEDGEATFFTRDQLGLTLDPIDGAALTPQGMIVAWQYELVVVFNPETGDQLLVHRVEEPIHSPEALPAVSVAPSLDGGRLWIVQKGSGAPGHELDGRADLVDVDDGEVLMSIGLPPDTLRSAVTSRGLLLNTYTLFDTGDGYMGHEGSHRVLELTFEGELTELTAGEAIAASGVWAAVLTCTDHEPHRDCDLTLVDTETGEQRTITQPVEGIWGPGRGLPGGPWLLNNRVSPDGRILLTLTVPESGVPTDGPGIAESYLIAVDPASAGAEVIHRVDGVMPVANWDRRGEQVVLIGAPSDWPTETVTVLDQHDGILRTMTSVLPSDHTVVHAR